MILFRVCLLLFKMATKQVIVIVPIYRSTLTSEEEVSFRHLLHFLGSYDMTFVAPQSLQFADERLCSLPVTRFADDFFSGIPGYNRLMLSCSFYERFKGYEYILIYQLDCLVFSNDLKSWCSKGWDYIGAPWFKDHKADSADGFWAVGNGGLSLRRVSSFLKVLRSKRLLASPVELGRKTRLFPNSPGLRRLISIPKAVMHNTMRHFAKQFQEYEDILWSFHAIRAMPDFKIPTPDEAVQFSFEEGPRYCFEKNHQRLPFGCHAWHKMDAAFWGASLIQEQAPKENVVIRNEGAAS
jgi:hypothetical protein